LIKAPLLDGLGNGMPVATDVAWRVFGGDKKDGEEGWVVKSRRVFRTELIEISEWGVDTEV
jgi:hypothetical protein